MEPFKEQSYVAGLIFFFILALLGTLTLLNIFIAVVSQIYGARIQESNANWEKEINLLHGQHVAEIIWPVMDRGGTQKDKDRQAAGMIAGACSLALILLVIV